MKTKDAAARFLAHRRIAVTGVSRDPANHGSNVVYQRLRERGYEVVAVNPNAESVEGDACYPDLRSVPGGVDAVVIGTSATYAEGTMREAVDLGITDVWMHRSFGPGSVSATAAAYGREHGVTVIHGGCPLMYGPTSDGAHRFMCRLLTLTGAVPRTV
jgi:predicted CoA-binding protein